MGLTTEALDPLAGDTVRFFVPPRRGRAHAIQVLEVLARAQLAEGMPLSELLRRGSAGLSWGSTIMAITGRESVPLFDTLFVMYIRWRRGLPVMMGSPDHIALRLRKWRLNTRQTVLASYVATASLGTAAVGMTIASMHAAAIVIGAVLLAALVLGVLLKRIDMSL